METSTAAGNPSSSGTAILVDRPKKPDQQRDSEKGVLLALWAPYNEVVQLIGDWNGWNPQEMKRGEDGWWRIHADLPDGDYLYKFRVKSRSYFAVGEMLDLFDPYALSVTDDGNENTILRIRGGRRIDVDYNWQHDDTPLPPNQDLIIYELHVGDFTGKYIDENGQRVFRKGRFEDAIEKLDYLKELGINCVELMPVKEFCGDGWGYCLRSLFAVESSYGRPEDLCRLIDECHARGIRVLIDGVYNHADAESALTKIDYEYWYYRENPDPPHMDWGPKFNYHHFDEKLGVFPARKYVTESIRFWVEKFHIDGIRFDATAALKHFDIMRELADAAYEKVEGIKPFFTVAEHVPEDPAITGREHGAPFDAAWNDSYGRLLQALLTGQPRDGQSPDNLGAICNEIDPQCNGYERSSRFVNFIGNHDFHRILHMLGNDAGTFDDAAFRRVKLGTALLIASPGLPMLWMGQEFGFSAEKSPDPRPLDWALLQHERNRDLLEFHRKLIRLRHQIGALRGESFQTLICDHDRKLFAFKRWDDAGGVVVVVANLRDEHAGEFEIRDAGLEDGEWRECVNEYDTKVESGALRDTLGESEVKIFIKKP